MTPAEPSPDDRETTDATHAADTRDGRAAHRADRPPTADEERIAEKVSKEVDPEAGEHYQEMAELGADVEGEGRIGG